MANDKLKLGDWNTLCDECGFKFKASMLRKRWDGLMVCGKDYELRPPQDFLRVPTDRPSVEWTRPEPADVFFTDYLLTSTGDTLITDNGDNLVW